MEATIIYVKRFVERVEGLMEDLMRQLGITHTSDMTEVIRQLEEKRQEYEEHLSKVEDEERKQLEEALRKMETAISSFRWMAEGRKVAVDEVSDGAKVEVAKPEDILEEALDLLDTPNIARGVELIQELAEQGYAEAQYLLGRMYLLGIGVGTKNIELGLLFTRKAAEQGYVKAQRRMGEYYENGFIIEKDYNKSEEWYLKAANQGDAKAQHKMSFIYADRERGKYDIEKKWEWLLKAAKQGYLPAYMTIGYYCRRYQEGMVLEERDIEEIGKFIDIASAPTLKQKLLNS